MPDTLPDFPTDETTLQHLLHALSGSYEVDDDGNHILQGAEFSLTELLDFMSGLDPSTYTVIDDGDVKITLIPGVCYSEQDVMRALILEIQRLRETC